MDELREHPDVKESVKNELTALKGIKSGKAKSEPTPER